MAYVHGAMDRSAAFLRVMRCLPDVEHLAFDRRGYGRSTKLGPAEHFSQHVDDLILLLEDRPAVVVGHSAGGIVALAAAEARPDLVQAAVVFEAPRSWADWWPAADPPVQSLTPEETVDRFMRSVAAKEWDEMAELARASRYRSGAALQADFSQMEEAPLYDATRIEVPVVYGYGTPRDWRHFLVSEELQHELAHCERHTIDNCDHGAHMTHPKEFSQLIRRGLALSV